MSLPALPPDDDDEARASAAAAAAAAALGGEGPSAKTRGRDTRPQHGLPCLERAQGQRDSRAAKQMQ